MISSRQPPSLQNLDADAEAVYVAQVIGEFKRTDAWAIIRWWLDTLYRSARDVYLNPDTSETHRLMALGHDQVIERLLEKFDEAVEVRSPVSGPPAEEDNVFDQTELLPDEQP